MILFSMLAAVLTIYSRSIRGEFLFDDPAIWDMDFERWRLTYQGKDKPSDPPAFWKALSYGFFEPRSLTHMGYFWTWQAAGFNPVVWHAVNMGFHLANTLLVYWIAGAIRPAAAPIAALLFAVHPHQVAAVSYISGRAGLQSVFFALLSVLVITSNPDSFLIGFPAYYLCILFSMRSKEDGALWCLIFAACLAASFL